MRAPSAKRTLDLAGSLLLLALLAPLLVATAVAVALTSPGGAFLRQTRAGLYGEPFAMLKFRTTRLPPTAERAPLAARNARVSRLVRLREDPRVGSVGRFLRRFSLDELPQLLNVVRGEMSLVGPRPLPVQDACPPGAPRSRLTVLPGITGLWQINALSELPWYERELLDLEYVDRHWLGLDLAILARTLPAVLTARDAH